MPMYVPAAEQLSADAAAGKPLPVAAGGTGATSAGAARGVLNGTGRTDALLDASPTGQAKSAGLDLNGQVNISRTGGPSQVLGLVNSGIEVGRLAVSVAGGFRVDALVGVLNLSGTSGIDFYSPLGNRRGSFNPTTGAFEITSGIKPSNASDAMTDYRDKPTFTPSLAGETTAGAPTYTVRLGNYTKVGSRVEIDVDIAISALGGAAGPMRITGLPFTSSTVMQRACPLFKRHVNNPVASMAEGIWAVIPVNSTFAELHFQRETGDSSRVNAMDFNLSGPARITGTLTYFV